MAFRSYLAAVVLLVAACIPFRKPEPPPVNTPELATVSDTVADSLLVDVQRVDSTFVVDIRYATPNNFTGSPLPGYEANRAYLRAEAAVALALVNADLRLQGLGLKIFDAYRPVRASEAMVAWTERMNRPDLLRDGYIASRSRHNLGLAVDLTLIDLASRAELAMGAHFDMFSRAAHTANARGVVATNRQRLKTVMERHGFENYSKEWWHYSYNIEDPVRFDRVVR
ncbi:MAG: D-alanyl-D-alanine carboxypeptidase family protein [Gemmatimonadaceae bacterium]|nr:D-alanyl-D-alanine carboxypeptidase family protein [Gemmatimonadaceae bacterium]